MNIKSKAVIHLHKQDDVNQIKRLALLFDEIVYVLPTVTSISKDVLNNEKRIIDKGKTKTLINFNFFKDTEQRLHLTRDSLNTELQEFLIALEENGIARELRQGQENEEDKEFLRTRNLIASSDINDKEFRKLSKTLPEDLNINKRLGSLSIKFDNGEELTLNTIDVPKAVSDSFEISSTLYYANQLSGSPVFLNPRASKELNYKYNQYKKGLHCLLNQDDAITPNDFRCNFGEVALGIANSVFSSTLLECKNTEDIIKYRNEMEESRLQLISKDLTEVSCLIGENPWNPKTKAELEKYISGKLWADVQSYNNKSKEIWEKLYGNITIRLAEISKSIAIGGSAGGIIGSVVPNASSLQFLMVGALAVATKEAPNVVKDLVETILEIRKIQRTSIAYIAKFK